MSKAPNHLEVTYDNILKSRMWGYDVLSLVNKFIEDTYSPEYRQTAKMNYEFKTKLNARIFLEWHNNHSCPLKFPKAVLKEIQKVAEVVEDESRIVKQEIQSMRQQLGF